MTDMELVLQELKNICEEQKNMRKEQKNIREEMDVKFSRVHAEINVIRNKSNVSDMTDREILEELFSNQKETLNYQETMQNQISTMQKEIENIKLSLK